MTSLVLIPCEEGQPVNDAPAAIAAGQRLGSVIVLAYGSDAGKCAAQLADYAEVERVLCVDTPDALRPECFAPLLVDLQKRYACSRIVAVSGARSRALLPRVAALLDVMPLSDIVEIVDAHTYVRPVHAGAALTTLVLDEPIHVLSIRASAFGEPLPGKCEGVPVEQIVLPASVAPSSKQLERTQPKSGDSINLIGARVVVSGGRGTGSAEGFQKIRPLADLLGAAVGASRAAVDAGYAEADEQVGQTGKSVSPELYIALGISGAVQHWAGMKDSKVIVAINKDPDAPIFQFADYGLVADLFDVLPALQASIERE